jgi:hypothetical protein
MISIASEAPDLNARRETARGPSGRIPALNATQLLNRSLRLFDELQTDPQKTMIWWL